MKATLINGIRQDMQSPVDRPYITSCSLQVKKEATANDKRTRNISNIGSRHGSCIQLHYQSALYNDPKFKKHSVKGLAPLEVAAKIAPYMRKALFYVSLDVKQMDSRQHVAFASFEHALIRKLLG